MIVIVTKLSFARFLQMHRTLNFNGTKIEKCEINWHATKQKTFLKAFYKREKREN